MCFRSSASQHLPADCRIRISWDINWITHALLVLAFFVALGLVLMRFEPTKSGQPTGDALAAAMNRSTSTAARSASR